MTRVLEGGHNIPEDIIERRYVRGIKNLFEIYLPISDNVFIFDNSDGNHEIIAERKHFAPLITIDDYKMNELLKTNDI